MNKNNTINKNDVLTDPAQIVRLDLENAGYNMDIIHIPKRVFLLADSFYDTMLSRNCGEYRYKLGGGFDCGRRRGIDSHWLCRRIADRFEAGRYRADRRRIQ